MLRARRITRSAVSLLTACLFTGALASASRAQTYPYVIEDLGSIPYTGNPINQSLAYGINSRGDVVMTIPTPDGAHIAVYKDGVGITDLGKPGDDRNGLTPVGITDTGWIALTLNPEYTPHAYAYDP